MNDSVVFPSAHEDTKPATKHTHHRRKEVQAFAGTEKNDIGHKKTTRRNIPRYWKKILLAFIILTLLSAGVTLMLFFMLPLTDLCTFDHNPSEYEILLCDRKSEGIDCSFDVSQCSSGCMLGYQQDQFACPVSCDCATKGSFESDVSFNPNNIQSVMSTYIQEEDSSFDLLSKGTRMLRSYWDKNAVAGRYRVPYVFSQDLSEQAKSAISEAISNLTSISCVDFYPRSSEADFIEFNHKQHGCMSFVGKTGGRQTVSIGKGCERVGVVQHELMHALGFWHEQSRPDRDDYVKIQLENIAEEYHIHFMKRGIAQGRGIVASYDKGSVMESEGYFYSDNGKPTIIDKITNSPVEAQRAGLSREDIHELNQLYNCKMDNNTAFAEPQAGDHWCTWSSWQPCSASCDQGQKVRLRECKDASEVIVYSGRCSGLFYESQKCESRPCEEGKWGEWSSCSVSCGGGVKHRASCCYPNENYAEEMCSLQNCPASEGNEWGEWGLWGECSRTCGGGYRRRKRYCYDIFYNKIDKDDCPLTVPSNSHYAKCAVKTCGIRASLASWNVWEEWSACSTSCGHGTQIRSRNCSISGECRGNSAETKKCVGDCQYEGTWGEWSQWTKCQKNCTGRRKRQRSCYYKHNQLVTTCTGGTDNIGKSAVAEDCTPEICLRDNLNITNGTGWSAWGDWSACSVTCSEGTRWRRRICLDGLPGILQCRDSPLEAQTCSTGKCGGSKNGAESNTSSTITTTTTTTTEVVETTKATTTTIQVETTEPTTTVPTTTAPQGWGPWESWTPCSVTCGTGTTTRIRTCLSMHCELNLTTAAPIANATQQPPQQQQTNQCPFENIVEPCEGIENFIMWNKCEFDLYLIECSSYDYYRAGLFNADSYGDAICIEPNELRVYTGAQKIVAYHWWRGPHNLCDAAYVNDSVVGDFNGDGLDDVACPHQGDLTVLLNNGNASFEGQVPITYRGVCAPQAKVHLAFMDADYRTDVVCASVPELSIPEQIVYNDLLIP